MNKIQIYLTGLAVCTVHILHAQDNEALAKGMKQMREEHDPAKSAAIMQNIIRECKLQEVKDAEDIDMMKGDIAMDYLALGKYDLFEKRIHTMSNKFNQTSWLNMGAATLLEKKKDPHVAEALARKTLTLYLSFKDDPSARPASMPKEDWDRFMKMAYFPYCDTYANALQAVGKNKQALEYQERALNGDPENVMPASAERYVTLLHLNGRDDEAYALSLKLVSKGKSTEAMNKLLRELYVTRHNGSAGFDQLFDSLQVNVVTALKEEWKKKMMDVEAPDFTLKDLEGHTVTLSALRGKTVIVDFWATWCVPCKASFPAMTKFMQRHPEVVFLYIATQEKPEGAEQRVKDYITKQGYPFHVLMDEPEQGDTRKFKALSAYKPQGIPAKAVIDAGGRQRFLSIGFSSDTELMNELEAMVQLAKG